MVKFSEEIAPVVEVDASDAQPDPSEMAMQLSLSDGVSATVHTGTLQPADEADRNFGELEQEDYEHHAGEVIEACGRAACLSPEIDLDEPERRKVDKAEGEPTTVDVYSRVSEVKDRSVSDEVDITAAENESKGRETGENGESLGSEARRDYMRNGGFILFTAVGHEVMEQARHNIVPRQIAQEDVSHLPWDSQPSSPSGATLGIVVNNLVDQLEDMNGDRDDFNGDNPGTFYAQHDITAEDIAEQEDLSIHQHGLGDMEFTWHFAAAIANHVVAEGVHQGDITAEEHADMTLSDWAGIIETPWFSTLIHDLALTDNGKYGSLGRFPSDYHYETVNNLPPFNHVANPFQVEVSRDSQTQRPQISSAQLDDRFRGHLRADMKASTSSGCPVARHHGKLSTERVATDRHAQSLIANGHLETIDIEDGKTIFTQEQTPIDVGLQVLAGHLRDYDTWYGTPKHLVAPAS